MIGNMLEVNTTFLLIGLIIVALTCIYLLYVNLTRANDTGALKNAISTLIQQNKKRDEVITFLLERVENLEANGIALLADPNSVDSDSIVNNSNTIESKPKPKPKPTPNHDVDPNSIAALVDELEPSTVAIQDSGYSEPMPTVMHYDELDALINEECNIQPDTVNTNATTTEQHQHEPISHSQNYENAIELNESNANAKAVNMNNSSTIDVVAVETELNGTGPDADLVSVILDTEDQSHAFNGDTDINLADVPRDKDMLNVKYTVKQLKRIAGMLSLKLKTKNKHELIDAILIAMEPTLML
jgi:hypothetical protein